MDARPVVVLGGEFDIFRSTTAHDALSAIDGPAILDLSDVTYLDSSFLNELARLRNRVDGELTLVVGSPQIRRLLKVVGFGERFTIVDGPAGR